MAVVVKLPENEQLDEEPQKIEIDHDRWIEWYKQYIADVRSGLRPEYKTRDSFIRQTEPNKETL